MRSLRYLNGGTLFPFPAEAGHEKLLPLRKRQRNGHALIFGRDLLFVDDVHRRRALPLLQRVRSALQFRHAKPVEDTQNHAADSLGGRLEVLLAGLEALHLRLRQFRHRLAEMDELGYAVAFLHSTLQISGQGRFDLGRQPFFFG